ncbi:MAG: mandelate racemase/muconate lactonizing enzyme family protein [Sphingobacteriaceae bacterium]|nr:mandelate racemase/muconate lactonizing enzyme family protein [Cytophagaceae bacterium]
MTDQPGWNTPVNRREFVGYAGALMALGMTDFPGNAMAATSTQPAKIKISRVAANFDREVLNPYRFKGNAITESWQTVARIDTESGSSGVGLCTQGVLWSDFRVFEAHSESAANALMYAMSEHALQLLRGTTFTNPVDLLDRLLPEVLAYGKKITGIPDLRKTFALNALVGVDNAAWLAYAQENKIRSFDDLIPAAYRPALSARHPKVASIPSFSVGLGADTVKAAADAGSFVLKLKTGSAGTQAEMIEKDIAFLTAVHRVVGHYETPYTQSGKIRYLVDPNGRYEKKETLLRFLDHAKKIGAFDQIAAIEEPFAETNEAAVGDLGVRIAADESAHTVEDAARRIEQGYGAIVLKGIAKTLSMTMKIAQLAFEKATPCFCADLTVNPILVDWNKCVAARLSPYPGMTVGLLETNGHQYYKAWDKLMTYHPKAGAIWTQTRKGVYETDDSFFRESGGIFEPSAHYSGLVS